MIYSIFRPKMRLTLSCEKVYCHPRIQFCKNYQQETYKSLTDNRARLSKIWIPTGGIAATQDEDSHAKLIRAGILRQAHSGIFHMLPLGRRVQQKLEALIDRHMFRLGASRLSLSSISSEDLWSRSGRLNKSGSELFRFEDRKSSKYLLSPTHEEEITSLVSSTVKSFKELPIRLYQITRKYRDELRPRSGLLRSREFTMKDLYTFDFSPSLALLTYHKVRETYIDIFNELKIPYLQAEADTGDIGGSLSHEFHFPTSTGEDHVFTCSQCDYVANEDLAETIIPERTKPDFDITNSSQLISNTQLWRGFSRDKSTLINVWYQGPGPFLTALGSSRISFGSLKAIYPEFDTTIDDASVLLSRNQVSKSSAQERKIQPNIKKIINFIDCRVNTPTLEAVVNKDPRLPIIPPSLGDPNAQLQIESRHTDPNTGKAYNLLRLQDDDLCPRCDGGHLKLHKAIELGHTFFLGTRYSEPLMATLNVPVDVLERENMTFRSESDQQTKSMEKVFIQMGCYGIGMSRLIGAVADTLADKKGLNWPRAMAPYEVVIISCKGLEVGAEEVYDKLSEAAIVKPSQMFDLVLDDRKQSFSWKMQDADLVGYPVIVVIGRKWGSDKVCEVQCRRLNVRSEVCIDDLNDTVNSILMQL
ncbi:unnamed protein product [Blumeria hordei]|uniref:proline--tRNA ligase n=1 Tax=Blumeria hordei TaxID=2867405 RepID=A0A383UJ92_BLUHO|nr:unnamed protein product [Blumeria hordei]